MATQVPRYRYNEALTSRGAATLPLGAARDMLQLHNELQIPLVILAELMGISTHVLKKALRGDTPFTADNNEVAKLIVAAMVEAKTHDFLPTTDTTKYVPVVLYFLPK